MTLTPPHRTGPRFLTPYRVLTGNAAPPKAYNLGGLYSNMNSKSKNIVKHNLTAAIESYMIAAAAGHTFAQHELANMCVCVHTWRAWWCGGRVGVFGSSWFRWRDPRHNATAGSRRVCARGRGSKRRRGACR